MTRFPTLAGCLVSLAAFAAATPGMAQTTSSVTQIVDKNIAAHGGESAWRSVQTLTLEGTMDAGGKDDHELPFVMKLKRSHKSRLEITFNNQTSVQVYDGTQGWKVRPFLNRNEVEPFTKVEASAAAASDELDGPLLDFAAKGTKVVLAGTEQVEGHPAYKLKLTLRNGEQRNVWIDTGSFLEVKIDAAPRMLDGKIHGTTVYYRNYQTEHGLVTARVLETAVDGVKQTHKIKISRLAANEAMSDSLFQKPQLSAAARAPVPKQR